MAILSLTTHFYRFIAMSEPTSTLPAHLALSLENFTTAVGEPTRWRILAELGKGAPLMVNEIARSIGRSDTVVSKHLGVLRRAGAVSIGRGRMYHVNAPFRVEPGILDFGYGRLRMAGPQG